jgi:uncharacterized membrane protein
MRSLLPVPLVVLLAAGGGLGVCALAGWNPHIRELLLAAGAVTLASLAAFVPLVLVRGASQLAVSQAALVGTMIHLFVAISFAAVAVLGHFGLDNAFLSWLLALYWVTLIVLVSRFVEAVKAASVTPAATRT